MFVSLYSRHIQHSQLSRGWSLFPSPNCPPILAEELQGDFSAPKALYPLSTTQQSPDISAQERYLNQEPGDVP